MAEHSTPPCIKFIFHLFKIFGVAPISFDSNFRFSPSKIGVAYNVSLIILVLINTYFAVDAAYFSNFAARVQLEKISDTLHTLILIFTALFILIIYSVRQKEIANIANELRRSIDVSSTLCCKKTYDEKSNNAIKELKFIVLLNLLTTSFLIISTPTSPTYMFLYFMCMDICNFIVNAIIMQYTIVMTLIAHLFVVLNVSLTEITNFKTECLEINCMQKYGLQMKLSKLWQCREFFTSLSRVSRKISIFMNMIMLACIFNIFVILTMYSYYSLKLFIVDIHFISVSVIVHGTMQLGVSVVSTVLLTKAGSSAFNQSKRTGEIVNECTHNEGLLCHPDVAHQLNLFSNYLLHTNVRFGVYNLFTLDETLLMSIAGSLTTYLVILLQFKQNNTT